MRFAAVASIPTDRSRPKIAPRNVTSSISAVTVELSSAPGYRDVSGSRMRRYRKVAYAAA